MTGLIELAQSIASPDNGAGGKVGAGEIIHKFIDCGIGGVQQIDCGINDFAQVVRGDVGRHTDTDTGTAVHQKLRKTGGKNSGFDIGFVKGGHHVHSLFFDVGEHFI